MQLSETSVRRPVFATVLSLLIILVGFVSYTRLNVREYPKIDNPVVTVETKYTGASSAVVESQVTKVLEDSLSGIEGVDVITSISRQEQSQITVNFVLSRDADSSAADVRDKVSRVRQRLPQGIDEPVIAKVEADAFPVIWLAMSSDTLDALQMSELANRMAIFLWSSVPDDELLELAERGKLREPAALAKQVMSQVATLKVALVVEVGVGRSWADAH